MHRTLSTRSGVLRSRDVAIPKVVKSAKSSNFAPEKEKEKELWERLQRWKNPPGRPGMIQHGRPGGGCFQQRTEAIRVEFQRRVNHPSNPRYAQKPKRRDQSNNRSMSLWN